MDAFARALVVFAHPDDAEFTCAGTVAKWAQAGTVVEYVCATDGSHGWNDAGIGRDEIVRIRREELRAAADVLGVGEVRMLGFEDGSLESNLPLRQAVTAAVRRFRPDVIVTMDPSERWNGNRTYINHPDHRAVGDAVLSVVVADAPTRPQFPELLDEGLEPHEVGDVWLAAWSSDVDTHVDISGTIDLKIKALRAHTSQIKNMGEFDVDAGLRDHAARAGRGAGLEYAEPFRTLHLKDGP